MIIVKISFSPSRYRRFLSAFQNYRETHSSDNSGYETLSSFRSLGFSSETNSACFYLGPGERISLDKDYIYFYFSNARYFSLPRFNGRLVSVAHLF